MNEKLAEHRFVTPDLPAGVPLPLAHTGTEHEIRIISCREATKREAQRYFEEI